MDSRKWRVKAVALAVGLAALGASGAMAQNIYKCGNTYSDQPCPGSRLVQHEDARSQAQQAQTSAAARNDAQAADALEKSRLREEALATGRAALESRAAATAPATPRKTKGKATGTSEAENSAKGKSAKGKSAAPEVFKAIAPAAPGDPPAKKKK